MYNINNLSQAARPTEQPRVKNDNTETKLQREIQHEIQARTVGGIRLKVYFQQEFLVETNCLIFGLRVKAIMSIVWWYFIKRRHL